MDDELVDNFIEGLNDLPKELELESDKYMESIIVEDLEIDDIVHAVVNFIHWMAW